MARRRQDEARLIADLRDPRNLPDAAGQVELITTHISLVFRTGRSVFKLKRERELGFLDYGTAAARHRCCEAEVRLNRRLASDVYLGVLPVCRDAHGVCSLNRPGETVDWVVHMRRLPDQRSALALLRAGTLAQGELERLAVRLAAFYRDLPALPPALDSFAASMTENFEQMRPLVRDLGRSEELSHLEQDQRAWFAQHLDLLQRRAARDGHGDLRLEHVYYEGPGEPLVIDCVEFQERLRIGDPALDVAFLAMDLYRNGRADLAEWFLARFAYECDDYDGFALFDGYASYRALVRAKVAAMLAADPSTNADVVGRKRSEARATLTLARELLAVRRPAPVAWAVGGLIGAGKTTVAEALARRCGAVPVSADATRKWLAGLRHEEHARAEHYTDAFTERVQAEVLRRAECVLRSGRGVILDSTFRSAGLRQAARALAERCHARFRFVECTAPRAVLERRLRERSGSVSDAREDLLARFVAEYEPVRELPPEQHLVVDTTRPLDGLVDEILRGGGA